uniref:Uncharacterized protein MANES_05G151400 n=1 Tax=Rhizophora mucronata TaxID=61149 RepID=A0A2P2IUI2_RHIMU
MEGVSESGSCLQMYQSPFGAVPSSSSIPKLNFCSENNSCKAIGMPPSHPNNPVSSWPTSEQPGSQNLNRILYHSRSLSQSAMFPFDSMPQMSQVHSVRIQPEHVLTDVPNEDKPPAGSQGMQVPSPRTAGNPFQINESLPPRRGHRRSMSDSVPLGFSAMIQSSLQLMPIATRVVYGRENSGIDKTMESVKHESEWIRNGNTNVEGMGGRKSEGDVGDDLVSEFINLESIDTWNSSGTEDKDLDSKASGSKINGTVTSDDEVDSPAKGYLSNMQGTSFIEKGEGLKSNASGDIGRSVCHYRSASIDSYIGGLQLDDESLKFPPAGTQVGQHSISNSMDGKLVKFNLEFGNGEFNKMELKKIMENEKLVELAMLDPKRVKRILANRLSAARSKERKLRYISELEQKIQTLQGESTTLSAQVTVLQRDTVSLTSQNNELKLRLQSLEQQAPLKDALNEALISEVRCLRVVAAEMGMDANQQLLLNHQVLHLQHMPAQSGQHV